MGLLLDTTVVAGATTTVQAINNDWKMTLIVGLLNLSFVILRVWQEEKRNSKNKNND